jgi:transcriptional regulator with XRE-family HTH domain
MVKESEIRMILGSNIKRYRMINRLSQEELAERVDISTNFLSSIEIGKKWVSPQTLAKLSNALNIESFELFRPQGDMKEDTVRYTDEIFQTIKDSIDTIHTLYRSEVKNT